MKVQIKPLVSLLSILALVSSVVVQGKENGDSKKIVSAISSSSDLQGTWVSSCSQDGGKNLRIAASFDKKRVEFFMMIYGDQNCSKMTDSSKMVESFHLGKKITSTSGDVVHEIDYLSSKNYAVIALDKSVSPPALIFADPTGANFSNASNRPTKLWRNPLGIRVKDDKFTLPSAK